MSTPVIICQGQAGAAWLHDVVMQDDFLSTWSAADKAADLAFELGYTNNVAGTQEQPRKVKTDKGQISFSDEVQVTFIDDQVSGTICLPRLTFESPWSKPWSMQQSPRTDFLRDDNHAEPQPRKAMDTSSTGAAPTSTPDRSSAPHPIAGAVPDMTQNSADESRDVDALTFWLQLLHGTDTDDLLIVTYGITHAHQGRRDFSGPADPNWIKSQAQQTWIDLIHPTDCRIDVVNPQPRLLLLRKYLVLLVSSVQRCPTGRKPVLADTRTPRDAVWPSSGFTAQHLRHPGSFEEHLLDLPYGRLCAPHGLRACDLMISGNYLRPREVNQFPTGALVRLNIRDLPDAIQRQGRYFPNFEEFALEVLDRINNGYGIHNGQIYLRVFGPHTGTNTYVDLHLTPSQLLQPQQVWSLIRRTWVGLPGQIEVNLLQPQLAVWSDSSGHEPIHLTLSHSDTQGDVPTVIQIVDSQGIINDFRFVMLPRDTTAQNLDNLIVTQSWWIPTDQIAQVSTFGSLAATRITGGRLIRVVLQRQSQADEPDPTSLFQRDTRVTQTRLHDSHPTTDACRAHGQPGLPETRPGDEHFIFNRDSTWMTNLIESLHQTNLVENEDEGRVIYVRTWFVNHLDGLTFASRVVRLQEADDIWWWQQDIAEAWQDVLPRLTNIEFSIVRPMPPRPRLDEATTEHVLLSVNREFATPDIQTAGIVSRILDSEVTDQVLMTLPATSTSTLICRMYQRRHGTVLDLEETFLDGIPVSDELVRVRHGTSWIITSQGENDIQSLMQGPRPSSAPQLSVPMHFFKRQQAYAVLEIRDENPTDALTEHWGLPPDGDDSISALHLINDPPDFIRVDGGVAYILCGRFEVRPLRLKLCWRFQIPRPNFIATSS